MLEESGNAREGKRKLKLQLLGAKKVSLPFLLFPSCLSEPYVVSSILQRGRSMNCPMNILEINDVALSTSL